MPVERAGRLRLPLLGRLTVMIAQRAVAPEPSIRASAVSRTGGTAPLQVGPAVGLSPPHLTIAVLAGPRSWRARKGRHAWTGV